jgi:hypothetical protein
MECSLGRKIEENKKPNGKIDEKKPKLVDPKQAIHYYTAP